MNDELRILEFKHIKKAYDKLTDAERANLDEVTANLKESLRQKQQENYPGSRLVAIGDKMLLELAGKLGAWMIDNDIK